MPHIHTGPGEHDHTASAYIVRLDMDAPKLMLHMHKKLGVLMQFGGHIELKENPWEAMLHEVVEEAGYEISQLELLQPHDRLKQLSDITLHPVPVATITHEFSPGHFHDDSSWAFVTHEAPKHQVADGETGNFRYVTADDLRAFTAEAPANIVEIGLYILENCVPNWEHISLK